MPPSPFEQLVYQVVRNYNWHKVCFMAAYIDSVSKSFDVHEKFINNERVFWMTSPASLSSSSEGFLQKLLESLKDSSSSFREDAIKYWNVTTIDPDKAILVQRLRVEDSKTFIQTAIELRPPELNSYSEKKSSPDFSALMRDYGISQSN